MTISLPTGLLFATLLVATRLAGFLLLIPAFPSESIPAAVRVAFVLSFSLALAANGIPPESIAALSKLGPLAMFGSTLVELGQGAFMAFGAAAAFAAFSLAGQLMDLQVGFGISNLLDPTTRRQGPLLETALLLTAIAAFFATDGHLLLLKLFAESTNRLPPGSYALHADVELMVRHFGMMFISGALIASPALALLLAFDAGIAVVSRSMPQMGVFLLALPVKTALGLTTLAVVLGNGGLGLFQRVLSPMYDFLAETVYR